MANAGDGHNIGPILTLEDEDDNEVLVTLGEDDPTSAGFEAPEGSLYLRKTGELYQKTGATDTDWSKLLTSAAGGVPVRYPFTNSLGETITGITDVPQLQVWVDAVVSGSSGSSFNGMKFNSTKLNEACIPATMVQIILDESLYINRYTAADQTVEIIFNRLYSGVTVIEE